MGHEATFALRYPTPQHRDVPRRRKHPGDRTFQLQRSLSSPRYDWRKAEGMTKCHIIRSSVAIEETFRDGALAGSNFDGWAATRSDSYFSGALGGRDTEEMLSSMRVLCGHGGFEVTLRSLVRIACHWSQGLSQSGPQRTKPNFSTAQELLIVGLSSLSSNVQRGELATCLITFSPTSTR